MIDYYHEVTGSPEASPAFEEAVERFEEALQSLEPDRDDEDAYEAWQAALRGFLPRAAVPPCAWCDSPSSGFARHNDGRSYPACDSHGLRK